MPWTPHRRTLPGLCVAAWLLGAAAATAQPIEAGTAAQPEREVLTLIEAAEMLRIEAAELERLAGRNEVPGRRIGSAWRFSRAALLAWLTGEWQLVAAAVPRGSAPEPAHPARMSRAPATMPAEELARVTAAGPLARQQPAAPTPAPADQSAPIGDAPEGRTAEEVFLRGRRVLLGRGDAVVDLGLFYSRSADLDLALLEDRIGLATIEQSVLTTLLLGRVGVFRETEVFASTALRSQNRQVSVGPTSLGDSRRTELGDVGLGIRRTFLQERAGRPDIIGSLGMRVPTGDSGYAVAGGLVLVKSVDPVVLFASGNYAYDFGPASSAAPRLDRQATVDATVGYGLALNDTLAISTAFSGLFRATHPDAAARRSDVFSGRFALTSRLTQRLYIEPSVSFGLNGPGDSLAAGVTIPYSF